VLNLAQTFSSQSEFAPLFKISDDVIDENLKDYFEVLLLSREFIVRAHKEYALKANKKTCKNRAFLCVSHKGRQRNCK
jgi:hypothetical protein